MVYIGIDLGTTYSCVSVIENGKPIAIHHDDGKTIVPSVVAYGAEILIGNDALNSNIDMSNILYDSKRLLGWEFLHDLPNAEARQLWTFNVDTRDKCAGYVLNKGTPNERFLKPEEVSAEILKYLKRRAEIYLNQKVTGVVVTVPAFFYENQKNATKKAIELAGLELKRLLHEPNAAAIAYNEKKKLGNSKLLVFDFGGGTLDVSILEMIGNDVGVMAVTGDIHLDEIVSHGAAIVANAIELADQFGRICIDNSPKQLKMPDFYNSQNEQIRIIIAAIFKDSTDLEKFARAIMNIKPVLNNPDAFDRWMKNEEIEFKEPPIQEAVKKVSASQSSTYYAITSEPNKNPNIRDAIAIDIGTSKCRIAICKEKYIQIVEHESNRSVPTYVAYSEQGEWLVGRMAENYAICLQNIFDGFWERQMVKLTWYRIRSDTFSNDLKTYAMMEKTHEEVQQKNQQETQKEKANWTDWIIAQISGIEPIVENFAGDDIDRLIFDKMMDKVTQQVAAIGAAAIVSKTVTVAEEFIGYEEVIEIIQEQEQEEEGPPPAPEGEVPTSDADEVSTLVQIPAPADNIPIPDKRHDGDNQLAEGVIKDHQYNPVKKYSKSAYISRYSI
ncbi:hypothetical protein WR25_07352 [Diploscapter pachys]|uniref:Uncharacterized protein n=1 Tax=Diploscapter pachys TaxID=2018661 RepID=A0A2A2KAZ7_9BILA|nr:hypothetical protein WR25_07352 [Diploscapter pachys]